MNVNSTVNKRGFTMLEVCMALAIMALLAAAIVPGLGSLYKQHAKNLANTFLLDMEKQRNKAKAMPKVEYYVQLTGDSTTITISPSETVTGYNSYIIGNDALGEQVDPNGILPTIPAVSSYTSEPYLGTHPKVSMGMKIDTADATGNKLYFDGKGAYTYDGAGAKKYVGTITLWVTADERLVYKIEINGLTGKTTWTLL